MFRLILPYLAVFASCCLGASFDCAKAAHPVEKAICSNPLLSNLDDTLSLLYTQTLKKVKTKIDTDKLIDEQRFWLQFVRTRFSSDIVVDSLIKTYSNRIEDFRLKLKVMALKKFSGGLLLLPSECMVPGTGDFVSEKSCNTISIAFQSNNTVDFTIFTTGSNCSRSCEASGTAKLNSKGDYVFQDSGQGKCRLTIKIGKTSVSVVSSACEYLCGDGAGLDVDIPFTNIIAHDFR